MREIKRIIIHHSAGSLSATAKQIRGWHMDKGWSDVGYHGVIEGDGEYHPCRPHEKVGAHAKGANADSIGICVVGDNTHPGREWRFVQIETLVETIRILRTEYPGAEVLGHRDVGTTATECPGVNIAELVKGI